MVRLRPTPESAPVFERYSLPQSAPRAIAQLVVDSIRITGKAFAAAGRQAMASESLVEVV
jgi:hypothetical protein